jgi:hypothetical protein
VSNRSIDSGGVSRCCFSRRPPRRRAAAADGGTGTRALPAQPLPPAGPRREHSPGRGETDQHCRACPGRCLAPRLIERYEAGAAEGAAHGFLALVGDPQLARDDRPYGPGRDRAGREGCRDLLRDRGAWSPRWTFGPSGRRPSPARAVGTRQQQQAPCSSRAASCSTPGSRPAGTPTSSARPTCSRCRRLRD